MAKKRVTKKTKGSWAKLRKLKEKRLAEAIAAKACCYCKYWTQDEDSVEFGFCDYDGGFRSSHFTCEDWNLTNPED